MNKKVIIVLSLFWLSLFILKNKSVAQQPITDNINRNDQEPKQETISFPEEDPLPPQKNEPKEDKEVQENKDTKYPEKQKEEEPTVQNEEESNADDEEEMDEANMKHYNKPDNDYIEEDPAEDDKEQSGTYAESPQKNL